MPRFKPGDCARQIPGEFYYFTNFPSDTVVRVLASPLPPELETGDLIDVCLPDGEIVTGLLAAKFELVSSARRTGHPDV
jgi:hypothetical protein